MEAMTDATLRTTFNTVVADHLTRFQGQASRQLQEMPLTTALRLLRNGVVLVVDAECGPITIYRTYGPFALVAPPDGKMRWTTHKRLQKMTGSEPVPCAFVGDELRAVELVEHSEGEKFSPWARTRRLLELERKDIAVVSVYTIAIGLISLGVPLTVQWIVNVSALGTLRQPLLILSLLLLIILLVSLFLQSLRYRVVEMLQRRVFVRILAEVVEILSKLRPDAFTPTRGPEVFNRFFDVFILKKQLASLILGGLDALLIALVGLLLLAVYHPLLLVFDIGVIVSALCVFFLLGRGGVSSAIGESKAKYALATWLGEAAREVGTHKSGTLEKAVRQRAEEFATQYLDQRAAHFRVVHRQFVGTLLIQVGAIVGLIVLGSQLVAAGTLSLGQLVAAELAMTAVAFSIAKLGGKVEAVYDLLAAVDKVGQVLDLPTERAERSDLGGPARMEEL